jgi:hypothetical protein
MKKIIKYLSFSFAIIFTVAVVVMAQDTKPAEGAKDEPVKNADGTYSTKKFNEAERPEDNYLQKFHAIDIVQKLMKRNLEQIYLLKVIVTNFSDKGWKGDYDKAYEGYKKAMDLYYKRNQIYARVEFENNRKVINDLLKKISEDFKKSCQEMLTECSEKILAKTLDVKTRSDPNRDRDLQNQLMRLKISYGQFDDAESAILDNNFEIAIYHFRVGKSYAIKILEDMAEDAAPVKEKYKFHKADTVNRIFEAKEETKGGGTTPPAGK